MLGEQFQHNLIEVNRRSYYWPLLRVSHSLQMDLSMDHVRRGICFIPSRALSTLLLNVYLRREQQAHSSLAVALGPQKEIGVSKRLKINFSRFSRYFLFPLPHLASYIPWTNHSSLSRSPTAVSTRTSTTSTPSSKPPKKSVSPTSTSTSSATAATPHPAPPRRTPRTSLPSSRRRRSGPSRLLWDGIMLWIGIRGGRG